MRLIYLKPELEDLSQGQRIAFAREFRQITQNELSDKLGITGEHKRRTMSLIFQMKMLYRFKKNHMIYT